MLLLLVECAGDSEKVQVIVVVLAVELQPVALLLVPELEPELEPELAPVLEPGLVLGLVPELVPEPVPELELGHWHQQSKK